MYFLFPDYFDFQSMSVYHHVDFSILSINDLQKKYCYLTYNAFISLSVKDN